MGQFLALSLVFTYPIIITILFVLFNKKRLIYKKLFSIYSIIFGYILLVVSNFSFYIWPYIIPHPILSLFAFIIFTGPQIILSSYLLKKYSNVIISPKKHKVRSCEICGEPLGKSTFSCPHCGAALTDETQREQITEDTYSLTAILKDKNDFETIKNKLLRQYAPHGYTNKVIDKAKSFMLKNNEIQQSYVSAKIKDYEITLEAFNVERPQIKIGTDGSIQN
ncbi:hypothetical protein [Sulfurovum sp.]|uniref:hypothetical protein n=1 Tax=Sulfurovum sp. TaxID=1969726 RepID=UPI003569949F